MVVTAEGNLLRVAILVNNGATIVSELILLHVHGSELDCLTITRLERIASALKACAEQLSIYYEHLPERMTPALCRQIRFPQPTLDPSETTNSFPFELKPALEHSTAFQRLEIKSFLLRDGKGALEWIGKGVTAAERATIMRGLFVAEGHRADGTSLEVAIKFSPTYNQEAHKFLAEKGHAPALHECRRVLGGMYMIVMDRVKGEQWSALQPGKVSKSTIAELERIVTELHNEGYVHGDLRECNVMVDDEGKVKVIDFDWAAKLGEGRYPKDINMENVVAGEWHPKVKKGGEITQQHDGFALEALISSKQTPVPAADD